MGVCVFVVSVCMFAGACVYLCVCVCVCVFVCVWFSAMVMSTCGLSIEVWGVGLSVCWEKVKCMSRLGFEKRVKFFAGHLSH